MIVYNPFPYYVVMISNLYFRALLYQNSNGFVGNLCSVRLPCYLVSLPSLALKYVESVETSQNAKSSAWLNGINHPICVGAATLVHNCLLMVACQWQ